MKRIIELDIFKGFAILLVVCGHVISANWIDSMDKNPVYTWIYSFHMPLFFFISGYLVHLTNIAMVGKAIMKKFLSLMLPYLTWRLILSPFLKLQELPSLMDLFVNTGSGYWFLYFLFIFSVLYYLSIAIMKGPWRSLGGGSFDVSNYDRRALCLSLHFV